MPGHEGAVPGSRYRRWRVPWVGRTRAVAPYLLCEVLAVILVLGSSVALVLALAWLLLRDCGSLGPRFLLPGLWWLPRLSPSVRLLPLGRYDGWFFGFRLHFLGISRSVFGCV